MNLSLSPLPLGGGGDIGAPRARDHLQPLTPNPVCVVPKRIAPGRGHSKLQGAYHNTQNGKAQKSQVPAQQTPIQGHDRDMGTTPNTAAIYVRRSALRMVIVI